MEISVLSQYFLQPSTCENEPADVVYFAIYHKYRPESLKSSGCDCRAEFSVPCGGIEAHAGSTFAFCH